MASTKEPRRETKASPVRSSAPTLAELQDRFQDAIMNGGGAILDLIPDNSRTGRVVLLGVYRHAYVSRLVEILGHDHPILARYLGECDFATMARAYVAAHPSQHANARWFSHGLPEFLAASADYGARAELGEMARIERAFNDAFDAKDAPVLEIADLSRVEPERWGELCFTPHPSAERLRLETNAFDIWRALKDDEAPASTTKLADRMYLVVWRSGTVPTARPFGAEEAMMWNEAARGVRFSVLCEMAATYADPEGAALRAAQYLHSWITAGLLSRAEPAPTKERRGRRRQGRSVQDQTPL